MYINPTFLISLALGISSMQSHSVESQFCPDASEFIFADMKDKVNFLPGFGDIQGMQMAGHLSAGEGNGPYNDEANLFYWFVGSERSINNDPIILWLNGGPGSSSFYGFFAENGPYMVQNDDTLGLRRAAWSKEANYLIIEQAPGIGYAYAAPDFHLVDEAQAIDMLFYALREFYKKYPELIQNALFIAGESYAGTSIPQLAMRILEHSSTDGQAINLQGILIGDGWVNPLVQLSANADFAYFHGLIDLATREKVQTHYHMCAEAIAKQTPSSREANALCDNIQNMITSQSGVTAENIRETAKHDYSPIIRYLNRNEVKAALHVDPRVYDVKLFSERISNDLEIGLQDSVAFLYPALLENGIRVLIYNGLDDGKDCNFVGTDMWLAALEWTGKEKLKNASTSIWRDKTGNVAGYVREADGLTQVKICGAGHVAPMDQPENVQEMVYRFIFEN